MLVLEWAYIGKDYVRCIVPIATSSRHSAWGISWGEAQRQSIYADPKYDDGYYSFEDPPTAGLGAARMSALLTYRSRNSFESRFGRNAPDASRRQTINDNFKPTTTSEEHWAIHNDGHNRARPPTSRSQSTSVSEASSPLAQNGAATPNIPKTSPQTTNTIPEDLTAFTDPQFHGATSSPPPAAAPNSTSRLLSPPPSRKGPAGSTPHYYSAQSYLRYQGSKFVRRFDSNCYIAITRKLDTHDVSRGRVTSNSPNPVADALSLIEQPTLVLGIESDGLFTFAEQEEIARGIKNARLGKIDSPEGHDAFLLQFEQVNTQILDFLRDTLPDIMGKPGVDIGGGEGKEDGGVGQITKSSVFGEAEVEDITAW
jgi:homoserine O-acetyltransferase